MKNSLLSLLLSYPLFINAETPSVELISELEIPGDSWHQAQDIHVHDNMVYLTYRYQSVFPSVLIIDVSDHSTPTFAGNYHIDISDVVDPGDAIESSVSFSNYALPRIFQTTLDYPNLYIPYRNGFEVVDISIPESPQHRGHYLRDDTVGGMVQVKNDTILYVYGQKLELLIKHERDEYELQSSLFLDQNLYRVEYGTDVIWDGGTYAYVLMQDYSRRPGQTSLTVVDVSDNSNPQIVNSQPISVVDEYLARVGGWAIGYIQLDSISLMNALGGRGSFWVEMTDHTNPQSTTTIQANWYRKNSYLFGGANTRGISVLYHPTVDSSPKLITNLFPPRDDDDSVYLLSGEDDIIVTVDAMNRNTRNGRIYYDVLKVYRVQQNSSLEYFDSFK